MASSGRHDILKRNVEKVINHLLDLQMWSFAKAEHTLILSMR